MSKQIQITNEGLLKLEEKLEYYKGQRRKEVSEKIKIALSFGDLSENSEYDEAKNEQAIVESEIAQMEATIKNAIVIDMSEISTDIIKVGNKVKLQDVEYDEEVEYTIVGTAEVDVALGKISDESPVGKALIGRALGETVKVVTPNGEIDFKVLEISK